MQYTEDLIKKVDSLKEAVTNLAEKVNKHEDARVECGKLYRLINSTWTSIDATIFHEEPSETERQLDAAIAQAYRIST